MGLDYPKRLCFPAPAKNHMTEHPSYLPEVESMISQPDGYSDVRLRALKEDRDELQRMFSEQAKHCPAPEDAMASPQMRPHGIGAAFSSLLKPFTAAFKENEAFLTPSDAKGRPITHYGLMATSNCAAIGSKDYYPSWKVPSNMSALGSFKDKDLFWWTSQQWAYLLRQNATLQSNMQRLKERLNWEVKRPILGLHVRQGDSCSKLADVDGNVRKCDDLSTYMEEAVKLAKQYGYKSIFLATDSAEVVFNTSAYPDFTWIYSPKRSATALGKRPVQKHPEIYLDLLWGLDAVKHEFSELWRPLLQHVPGALAQHPPGFELLKQLGDKFDFDLEFRDFLVDLFLLADADGFVGKFTSNFDRMAYALGVGQSGCATPFVSLDSVWCNNFGGETGKSLLTNKTFWC